MPKVHSKDERLADRKMALEFMVDELTLPRVVDLLCELHRERRHQPEWFKTHLDAAALALTPDLRNLNPVNLDATIASLRQLADDLQRNSNCEI